MKPEDAVIGANVWVLSGSCVQEGKISSFPVSSSWGAYVKTYHGERHHTYQRLFRIPQDAEELYKELLNDADYLYNKATEIKKQIPVNPYSR